MRLFSGRSRRRKLLVLILHVGKSSKLKWRMVTLYAQWSDESPEGLRPTTALCCPSAVVGRIPRSGSSGHCRMLPWHGGRESFYGQWPDEPFGNSPDH